MSPARSRRTPIPHRRSRVEVVRAAGVATGIVVATAALIWLLRPGPPGTAATGGLMNRQPRASGLVALALGMAAFVTWWILRVSRRARGAVNVVLPIAVGVVLVATVVAGIMWPGGLLRHEVTLPTPVTPTTTPTTLPPSTTGATSTTGTGSSTTTPTTGSPTIPRP